MLKATTVTKHDELVQINLLNQQNIKHVLTEKEKAEEGYVTWLYPIELLEQMHALSPAIIVKDETEVVGYALATTKEAAPFHTDLKLMIENLEKVVYKSQPLTTCDYYLMGQICIAKSYRGQGIFGQLYQKHKEVYGRKHEMLVTEIATANLRSQRAHEKVGFETIHTYRDSTDEWNVVVWDWRQPE